MSNIIVEFQKHSVEFLRLLGAKQAKADKSPSIQLEAETLEYFYTGIQKMFERYEQEKSELRIMIANLNARNKVMDMELEEAYRKIFTSSPPELQRPSPVQIEKIRQRLKSGASIYNAMEHFKLSDEQIIDLLS